MKNKCKNSLKNNLTNKETGIAAVEFALILPLLLIVVFGIINFGLIFFDYLMMTNAAREGARWASINAVSATCSTSANTTDPCGVARTYMPNLISLATSTSPVVSYTNAGFSTGNLQTVTITYSFKGGIYLANLLDVPMSTKSVMYHE